MQYFCTIISFSCRKIFNHCVTEVGQQFWAIIALEPSIGHGAGRGEEAMQWIRKGSNKRKEILSNWSSVQFIYNHDLSRRKKGQPIAGFLWKFFYLFLLSLIKFNFKVHLPLFLFHYTQKRNLFVQHISAIVSMFQTEQTI